MFSDRYSVDIDFRFVRDCVKGNEYFLILPLSRNIYGLPVA